MIWNLFDVIMNALWIGKNQWDEKFFHLLQLLAPVFFVHFSSILDVLCSVKLHMYNIWCTYCSIHISKKGYGCKWAWETIQHHITQKQGQHKAWHIPSPKNLTRWPWPWKSIGFQILLRTKYIPSLVKIHWRMLILECSQGCYRRTVAILYPFATSLARG